jgi:hypothetical protein
MIYSFEYNIKWQLHIFKYKKKETKYLSNIVEVQPQHQIQFHNDQNL